MYELFMDIPDYEGLYQVSNMGNVKNVKTGKLLKPCKGSNGYMKVELFKNRKGKWHSVHRLVLSAFKANPDNKPEVNHINEDKTDNRLNNLEWVTRSENNRHGTRGKRMSQTQRKNGHYEKLALLGVERCKQMAELNKQNGHYEKLHEITKEVNKGNKYAGKKVMCIETGKIYDSAVDAAKDNGLANNSGIIHCCKGTQKTAKGLHWKYYEGDNNESAE